MERLSGIYSRNSKPVKQEYFQTNPTQFHEYMGWRFPIKGPFSFVQCNHGFAILYCSAPGETPLYYNCTQSKIAWGEQQRPLGRGAKKVLSGELVIWEPGTVTKIIVDELPRPAIASPYSSDPFKEYAQLLIEACACRITTLPNPRKVAISQSGGLDSLLLAWACRELGIEFVPLTVCTSPESLDYVGAVSALKHWGVEVIPCFVTPENVAELLPLALSLLEDSESCNVRMQIGNILVAQKMRDLQLEGILNGHGHDDVHGKGNLVKGVFKLQKAATAAERWRDARYAATTASSGMLKMFSSCFRHFDLHCRLPYYDNSLLKWAFSQPVEILPPTFDKQFVRDFANHVLPPGEWQEKRHSVGYLTGAGLSLKQPLFAATKENWSQKSLGKLLQSNSNHHEN